MLIRYPLHNKGPLPKPPIFKLCVAHIYQFYIWVPAPGVCAKYQKASVKALVQVDFLMYALSKHKNNS